MIVEREVASELNARLAWYGLVFLIVLVFLMGGGARDDIRSLLVLRPLTAIMLVAAIWIGFAHAWRTHRALVIAAASPAVLMVLHLIPLPPALWSALPGRDIIVGAFAATGQALPWLPLSIAPDTTWNALFFWMAPFAALLLALRCLPEKGRQLLMVVLAIGVLGVLLGTLQVTGPANGPLYFYKITNNGSAVGWFSNRNHFAMFLACLFPLIAAHLSLLRADSNRLTIQRNLVLAGGLSVLPLLLVTGSRGGLVLGVLGLILAWFVYSAPLARGRRVAANVGSRTRTTIIAGLMLLAVALLFYASSRALSLERLFDESAADDLRWKALPAIWDAIVAFFPFGSGIGTFVEAYQIHEPSDLIRPNYYNHAHSDFVELALTGGLPVMLGIVAALLVFLRVGWQMVRAGKAVPSAESARVSVMLARAGLSVIALLIIGSAVDYPLRTPALAVLMAVCVAGVALGWRSTTPSAIAPATRHGLADARSSGKAVA